MWGDEYEELQREKQYQQDIIDGSYHRRNSDESFTTLGLQELIDEDRKQELLERREEAYHAVLWEQYYQWNEEDQQLEQQEKQQAQQEQQQDSSCCYEPLKDTSSQHTATTRSSTSSASSFASSGDMSLLTGDSCHSKNSTTSCGTEGQRSVASLNFNGNKDEALAHVYQNAASKKALDVAREQALRLSMSLQLDYEEDEDDEFFNNYSSFCGGTTNSPNGGVEQLTCSFETGLAV